MDAGRRVPVVDLEEMTLGGAPNLLNACASVAAVEAFAPDAEAVAEGLRSFAGLPHRQQIVARRGGLVFVDDSKATNVHAVCAGLAGYEGNVHLILGGSGKGEDYTPLRDAMAPVASVVVMGDEADRIAAALADRIEVVRAVSMADAVAKAAAAAGDAGTVLLSPACASFDMFSNYKARGEAFRAEAEKLAAAAGEDGP